MISISKTNNQKTDQKTTKRGWDTAFAVLFWLAVWEIASLLLHQDLLLVSPVTVFQTLFLSLWQGQFWSTVLYSFSRIVTGFFLAILVGVSFAVLSATNDLVKTLLSPFFSVVKSVPVASFIILVLIWAGSGSLSIVISFLMVLPIIYTNTLEGILATDEKLLEMARVFHMPIQRRVAAIYIPAILPFFSSACKVGLGLSWKSGIAAEVIGLPTGSIGEQLYQAKIFLSTADLFCWTIVIVLISHLFERFFLALLRRGEEALKGGAFL